MTAKLLLLMLRGLRQSLEHAWDEATALQAIGAASHISDAMDHVDDAIKHVERSQ